MLPSFRRAQSGMSMRSVFDVLVRLHRARVFWRRRAFVSGVSGVAQRRRHFDLSRPVEDVPALDAREQHSLMLVHFCNASAPARLLFWSAQAPRRLPKRTKRRSMRRAPSECGRRASRLLACPRALLRARRVLGAAECGAWPAPSAARCPRCSECRGAGDEKEGIARGGGPPTGYHRSRRSPPCTEHRPRVVGLASRTTSVAPVELGPLVEARGRRRASGSV
ncbi:hypothetical protein C8Q77DRAFT_687356 [Trametes polyzona]|nr:hypothetical protein C8Q77DRAFT_687356 [Trametes polyzona]